MILFINLVSAIILTINTPPGGIPKGYEWDINEDAVIPYNETDKPVDDAFDN